MNETWKPLLVCGLTAIGWLILLGFKPILINTITALTPIILLVSVGVVWSGILKNNKAHKENLSHSKQSDKEKEALNIVLNKLSSPQFLDNMHNIFKKDHKSELITELKNQKIASASKDLRYREFVEFTSILEAVSTAIELDYIDGKIIQSIYSNVFIDFILFYKDIIISERESDNNKDAMNSFIKVTLKWMKESKHTRYAEMRKVLN